MTFTIRVTNHEPDTRLCEVKFRSVDGTELSPAATTVEVAGGGRASCELRVTFPKVFNTHALPVVADVTWQGRTLGEIAESIAYW